MPANVGFHVVLEGKLAEGKGLLAMSLRVKDKGFHSLRVAMIGVLAQNLFCGLDTWWSQYAICLQPYPDAPFLYCLPS